MNLLTPRAAPLLAATLLAACASPSPAPVLLTLPPAVTVATVAPAAAASAPVLAVRRVHIPEYLVARRVRYRADASTLAEWPNTYWAERIEIGVSREFVSALRQQLPGWSLCDTDCGEHVPRLALHVELVPMDYARSAQKLSARARITVSSAGAVPQVLQVLEKAYELPGTGDSAQAQAQAISELIRQVAAAAAPLVQGAGR
ncbi:MAG: ABC-type transport auxiliary lipoprotein family protein [Rhizobacter sp.]